MQRWLVVACLPAIAGCSDLWNPTFPEFEGTYAYSGTVDGHADATVSGTLVLSEQIGELASAITDLELRVPGVPDLSHRPSTVQAADLGADGSIWFEEFGSIDSGLGVEVAYRLIHDGTLSGHRISGRWTLEAEGIPELSGSFTATR